MKELNPTDLGRQLRKPSGDIGLRVAENMNSTNKKIYDFVLSRMEIKDQSTVLEIGCGNGKFIPKFFEKNGSIKVWAIDFSKEMAEETGKNNQNLIDKNQLLVKCEDSSQMSLESDFFDQVVTINTIYFWEPFEAHIREIKRVLRKGGQLVTGYRSAGSMVDLPFTKEVFRHFEPEQLKSLISQSGFRIVSEESNSTTIDAVDGKTVTSVDRCLIVEKN